MLENFAPVIRDSAFRSDFGVARPDNFERPAATTSRGDDAYMIRGSSFLGAWGEPHMVKKLTPATFGLARGEGDHESIAFARAEDLEDSYSYSENWRAGRRCIVPVKSFVASDPWGSKGSKLRISRHDGRAIGIAGIWNSGQLISGQEIFGFLMVSISAGDDIFLGGDGGRDNRMVALLEKGSFDTWLHGSAAEAKSLLGDYPDGLLQAKSRSTYWKKGLRAVPKPETL